MSRLASDEMAPRLAPAVLLAAYTSLALRADAGHEVSYYPSFYPQEIRIETVDPASARTLLERNALHAYIGADPFGGGPIPANVSYAESLGSYVVVTFNPGLASLRKREARCAAAREAWRDLARRTGTFVFHPHPVTPYHQDYLHHADVVGFLREQALQGRARESGSRRLPLRMRGKGELAEDLARSGGRVAKDRWEATIEEVDIDAWMAPRRVNLNGWLGPPWLKEGWFHAYLLLADKIADPARVSAVERIYQGLVSGAPLRADERVGLERDLLSLLTGGCERVVAGYTVRRTYFNADYSAGIENIAQDSHAGFLSPVFVRTVKLKDFPWNGWLRLGVGTQASAAWNPIGGFTDPVGRLVWYAVGDPAFFPAPHSGSWVANRVAAASTVQGPTPLEVPPDALIPDRGSGALRPVGSGKTAAAKVSYSVPMSAFHDGSRMTVADLWYAFVLSFRDGARRAPGRDGSDRSVEASTEAVRERLVGLKLLRLDTQVKDLGEIKVRWEVPVIEVYLRHRAVDPEQVASMIPPWSTLPWHLLVVMEEAVDRGVAAFSEEEARRRGVAWLDLVRDPGIRARLAVLVEDFERQGYVPGVLKGLVTADEARRRWTALKRFFQEHGHLLVTNGPYRMEKWSGGAVVLQVFRDLSYPVGLGTFDRYALPPRAFIAAVERQGDRLRVSATLEKAVKAQRAYTLVREPLRKTSTVGPYPVQAVCRFLVVGLEGAVARAGTGVQADDGGFALDLGGLGPGRYTVAIGVYLNGNHVNPDVKLVEYRVPGGEPDGRRP